MCSLLLLLLLLPKLKFPPLLLKHLQPFGGWWVGPWRLWGAAVRLLELLGWAGIEAVLCLQTVKIVQDMNLTWCLRKQRYCWGQTDAAAVWVAVAQAAHQAATTNGRRNHRRIPHFCDEINKISTIRMFPCSVFHPAPLLFSSPGASYCCRGRSPWRE